MREPWWSWTGLLVSLGRRVHRGKSSLRRLSERPRSLEVLEARQYLSAAATINEFGGTILETALAPGCIGPATMAKALRSTVVKSAAACTPAEPAAPRASDVQATTAEGVVAPSSRYGSSQNGTSHALGPVSLIAACGSQTLTGGESDSGAERPTTTTSASATLYEDGTATPLSAGPTSPLTASAALKSLSNNPAVLPAAVDSVMAERAGVAAAAATTESTPAGMRAIPGEVVVSIKDVTPKSVNAYFTNMAGKTSLAPLSAGLPSAPAVGQAALKTALNAILDKIDVSGVGKVVNTAFAGVRVGVETTLTKLTATIDVSVDVTVATCVQTREGHWYTPWNWPHNTGQTHWETESDTINLSIDGGSIDLSTFGNGGGVGISALSALDVGHALDAVETNLRQRINNINVLLMAPIRKKYPGTTIEAMAK